MLWNSFLQLRTWVSRWVGLSFGDSSLCAVLTSPTTALHPYCCPMTAANTAQYLWEAICWVVWPQLFLWTRGVVDKPPSDKGNVKMSAKVKWLFTGLFLNTSSNSIRFLSVYGDASGMRPACLSLTLLSKEMSLGHPGITATKSRVGVLSLFHSCLLSMPAGGMGAESPYQYSMNMCWAPTSFIYWVYKNGKKI